MDGIASVLGGNVEIVGYHVIDEAPSVVGAVDGIVIHKCGVSATVGDITGVDAFLKGNIRAAVGDDGQGGGVHFGEAVNRNGIVGCRREAFRVQCISESPGGVVSGTVGITITEDHCSGAVGVDVGGAVHKDWNDAVATGILNDWCCWAADIGQAGHGSVAIIRHSGNIFW